MGLGTTIDTAGNTYVTGGTQSRDFPVTPGAAQAAFGGSGDAFVAKIDRDGNVVYATYLGGSGLDEGRGIAIDGSGHIWVAGFTESSDFPTVGAGDSTLGGSRDAFLAQLSPDGALQSSTLLGGDGEDGALALALDPSGSAYLTGETASTNFPTTDGAYDRTQNGDFDAYASKFSSAGELVYSTVLGGPGFDNGLALAVDSGGSAYVAGKALPGYPVTSDAFDTTPNGGFDMFVTKLDPTGATLAYSTYVGGNDWDEALGIAVDGGGNAYLTGNVQSRNYPVTPGAVGGPLEGTVGAAVTKLDPSGSSLVYSGVLGGRGAAEGDGLAVDSRGAAYISGHQFSSDYPTTSNALDTTPNGGFDGFLSKVDPSGTTLEYSTLLGGSGWDGAMAMTIDDAGNAYLTGATGSEDFPTTSVTGARGGFDAFATRIDTQPAVDPAPAPGFTLDVSPRTQAVGRGGAVTYTATVSPATTSPPVTFSIEGLPPAADATFEQQADGSTVVTVQTSETTPPGGYSLVIVARSGESEQRSTVRLDIHCCPLGG
jgi:hypothetical protein